MTDIAILISCHKPSVTICNDIIRPIQVGSALSSVRFTNMLHDDEGENISSLNKMYCELTAQYWAWKNLDADYYGFFHYRRYLSFNNPVPKLSYDTWGNVILDSIDSSTESLLGLIPENIRHYVKQFDVVLPEEKDISQMPDMGKTCREQFSASGWLHEKDLQVLENVLAEKYPEYGDVANEYFQGSASYLNNMFIMKKDIFHDFCKWEFDILEECRRRIDISDYSVEAIRTLGHLAERLLNIYIRYLKRNVSIRFAELPTVAVLNTDPENSFFPVNQSNNVAIALSADNYYVPYLAAVLLSIKDHISADYGYDIIVIHKNISRENQQLLVDSVADAPNISVRFYNIKRYSKQFENLFLRGHFHVETYYRLLMPEVFPAYDKMLYLDSDIIVNADLAELYETDVSGFLLAACHDADTAGLYNGFEPGKKPYMDNVLKIQRPYEYFQAGVILFNLDEFRNTYSSKEMLSFAASYKWELLDQDVLNYLAQGHYKAVDMAWNVMTNWRGIRIPQIIARAPKYLYDEYMEAHAAPKVIHYAGPDKPWQSEASDYAEFFWRYARQSVFYEQILYRLSQQAIREILKEHNTELNKKRVTLKIRIKRWVKRICKSLFPGLIANREARKKALNQPIAPLTRLNKNR